MARKKRYADTTPDEPDAPETIGTSSDGPAASVSVTPPMPMRGPLGDLTLDVVEWYRLYDPAEYERRYIRPGHPKGPRIRVN